MPDADLYANGFKLKLNMVIQGYQLTNLNIGHNSIRRYREYSYPTNMTWKVSESTYNRNLFEQELKSMLQGSKTINSEYGNPYSCTFGELVFVNQADGSVYVSASGTCIRV